MPEPSLDPKRPPMDPDAPAPKAPRMGCFFFGLVFAFFTGALVFALVQGARTYKLIESFTEESPVDLPAERGTTAELAAAKAKVKAFLDATKTAVPPPSDLALSAKELNILIANDNYLSDIRGRFFIEGLEVGEDGRPLLRTVASRPRPRIVFWKPRRYLNAEIDVRVEADVGQIFFRVADVRVEGKTIDPGLLEYMKTEDLLDMYKNDEAFETVAKKISSARVEGDQLVVSTEKAPTSTPGQPGPSGIPTPPPN